MTIPSPFKPAPGEFSFETSLANQIGVIRGNLIDILDRNPQALPAPVRARLVAIIGKCEPLASVEHLKRLRDAYED